MKEKVIKYSVLGAISLLAIVVAYKLVNKIIKNATSGRTGNDPNVDNALFLRSALYPSGKGILGWMEDKLTFKEPNIKEIFRLFDEITNYKDVATEYANLYDGDDLTIDLQDVLGNQFPLLVQKMETLGQEVDPDIVNSNYEDLAIRLNNEIEGINWFVRNLEPFKEVNYLSMSNLAEFNNIYNSKFGSEETLLEQLEEEFGEFDFEFSKINNEIIENLKKITL